MWSRVKNALPVSGAPLFIFLMFLDAFSVMLLSPIIPLFIRQFVENDAYVGYIFSFNAIILIFATLLMSVVLRKFSKIQFLKMGLLGYGLTFFFLAFVQNLMQLLVLSVIRMLLSTWVMVTMGLLLRDSVSRAGIGRAEGYYFTFLNVAALAGPALGGILAAEFGYSWTFIIASIFPLLAFVILLIRKPYELHVQQNPEHNHVWENMKDYFKNKNLLILYSMSIGIAFFWALVYTYLPLYLEGQGWGSALIGYTLAIFVIPLLALELLVGKGVDRIGAKKFFVGGFILLGFFTGLSYLYFSPVFLVVVMIVATFGAAFVEPVREAFLFKITKVRDEVRFYTVYATAFSVGSMVGPLLFSSVLLATNFQTMFLFGAILMLCFSICAMFIHEKEHTNAKQDLHHRAPGEKGVSVVPD